MFNTSSAWISISVLSSARMGVPTSVRRSQPRVKNSDPRSGRLLNLAREMGLDTSCHLE